MKETSYDVDAALGFVVSVGGENVDAHLWEEERKEGVILRRSCLSIYISI